MLTIKQKMTAIRRILKGDSYSEIARDLNVTSSYIGLMGQEMGISKMPQRKHTLKWTAEAIDNFLITNKSTIRRASSNIKHCKTTMTWKCTLCNHQWEQKFDTIRRSNLQGCINCGRNPYTVFHDFLDTLTPISAYFMGVYVANGLIKGNEVSISSKDKIKLEKIANLISCTFPIKEKQWCIAKNPTYYLKFKSTKIAQKLANIKTTIHDRKIPKDIDAALLPHFLRGYIDFKGYVVNYMSALKTPQARLTIYGHLDFLKDFQACYKNFPAPDQKERNGFIRKNNCEFYIVGAESIYYFMDWIYNSEVNPLRYVSNSMYQSYINVKENFNQIRDKQLYIMDKRNEYKQLQNQFHESLTFCSMCKRYNITMDQIKGISTGRRIPRLPMQTIREVSEAITKRKQLKKQLKELQTRMYNKTGVKSIDRILSCKFIKE
jgi:hypothetical protein